jgi:adenylosuccinate synthase
MKQGRANVLIDGQWGSTGKGKLAGYLANNHKIDMVVCNFAPNAGHTYIKDGVKSVVCQLPTSGIVSKLAIVALSAGSVINIQRLMNEINEYPDIKTRLFIHPNCAVVSDKALEMEEASLDNISSTKKGAGASLALKIMRNRDSLVAKNVPELAPFIADTVAIAHRVLRSGGTILIETAQGFDLSINHGNSFPYTTSRDVTVATALNDAGIPTSLLGEVYGCLRTYPIRVGNAFNKEGAQIGWSGPFWQDQVEITWEDLKSKSGAEKDITEKTTVTGKIRRVFTFSKMQLSSFVSVCDPDFLFLNFVNHIDNKIACIGFTNVRDSGSIDNLAVISRMLGDKVGEFVREVEEVAHSASLTGKHPKVVLLGTGPDDDHMIDLR